MLATVAFCSICSQLAAQSFSLEDGHASKLLKLLDGEC